MSEDVDVEKFVSADQVSAAIVLHKDNLVRKFKFSEQIKQAKREAAAAYREQLAEVSEELDHELGVIGNLEDRLKIVTAQGK